MQTTSKVLMVKPARFAFNPQTGGNNAFSRPGRESSSQENALREFTSYVSLLRANKIDVVIAEDTPHPHTPDSIFPNNWFSTHGDGTLVLYPMSAPNRRNERKPEVLEVIRKNFEVRPGGKMTISSSKGPEAWFLTVITKLFTPASPTVHRSRCSRISANR